MVADTLTVGRWKERLADCIPPETARDLNAFQDDLRLARQGRLELSVFTEILRRRGVYGQRYDHGRRNNGRESQELPFPPVHKGKGIFWDAPGMQRIKLPFGALSPEQMETIADLAEEYADGAAHATTRQDIQLHYVHLDDTPDLMLRLAAVGLTTREACGNTVRNVTACPLAGVCRTEAFDVSPHARAVSGFLLGHPDAQDLGRKFKISFSGCAGEACGLARMHDIGAVAAERDGARGFALWVGGGLGAVPQQAKLLSEFLPERELIPVVHSIVRVFARHGDKSARNKARMKFLVAKLGLAEFARRVDEERACLPDDPRWTQYLEELQSPLAPLIHGGTEPGAPPFSTPEGTASFQAWRETNVSPQKQAGYVVAAVTLPLGDLSPRQLRGLAGLARRFWSSGQPPGVGEQVRLTVEQNLVLRWVREAELPALHAELATLGLAEPGAGSIVDVTACPGTDTCRLGIASSRGLAAELRARLAARNLACDEALGRLRVKVSGCFNSCGQHHIADLGFYGSSRSLSGHVAPHFMLLLGGSRSGNAESFGLPLGSLPARAIPDAVERITARFASERERGESFQAWLARVGKKGLKAMLDDLKELPEFEQRPEFYYDWGESRKFSLADMMNTEGPGPPAVRQAELLLAEAERELWRAQLELEEGDGRACARSAGAAMRAAAAALVRADGCRESLDDDALVAEFRARLVETGRLDGGSGAGRFAHFFLARQAAPLPDVDREAGETEIHRARLFLEAAHAAYARLSAPPEPPASRPGEEVGAS